MGYFMDEQEEPVRRRAALKVIKLGMDTRQVIARFDAERQALALMDHLNIAKILEAGVTGAPVPRSAGFQPAVSPISNRHPLEDPTAVQSPDAPQAGSPAIPPPGSLCHEPLSSGRPYFVMELVRGLKITDFCGENQLSTQARLKLFIQVCQAVQHAHQKGVIHRDLKPSNIPLVTVNDGVPVPKVIDFGIAKATTGQWLTDLTIFTEVHQFIGTLAYMSPEQAVMANPDIDTRSDIYSLGVLLYELLTGKTPFDKQVLLAAGLGEMRRTILEREPPKPSTRLSAMIVSEVTTTAKRRHTEPPKLVHRLRGDLDCIVMKCLEKDRARRYETASGLARDLERHLNSEPVVARPPGRLYEFHKAVRRHKFGVGATAAVILTLAAGAVASNWQAVRATRAEQEQILLRHQAEEARARAEVKEADVKTEAHKSRQVSRFLQEM